MKVLGIIPSRYGSSRFPGKPLIDIAGKTMIQRVYEQALKSAVIDKLIVATDDQRIYDHVLDFGGEAIMTSEKHDNGTQRCGEVLESQDGFDVIINIQGDEPLIQAAQLDKVLNLFEDNDVSIGTLVKPISDMNEIKNPNRIKVVLNAKKDALYFSRNVIPFNRKENELEHGANMYFKHIGIYAWRIEVLNELVQLPPCDLEKFESLEQLRWLFNGYSIRTAETLIETPNIDTPEDLEAVLRVLNA